MRSNHLVGLLRLGDHLETPIVLHGDRRAAHGEQHRVETADMKAGNDGEEDGHGGSGG